MKKLTMQDVLDKNWEHFIVKRKPFGWSIKHRRCIYSDARGTRRCAVGLCFPRTIGIRMNGGDLYFNGLASIWAIVKDFFDESVTRGFLMALQDAHDTCAPKAEYMRFGAKLEELAKEYNLSI